MTLQHHRQQSRKHGQPAGGGGKTPTAASLSRYWLNMSTTV
jgi:hypothetical protein